MFIPATSYTGGSSLRLKAPFSWMELPSHKSVSNSVVRRSELLEFTMSCADASQTNDPNEQLCILFFSFPKSITILLNTSKRIADSV